MITDGGCDFVTALADRQDIVVFRLRSGIPSLFAQLERSIQRGLEPGQRLIDGATRMLIFLDRFPLPAQPMAIHQHGPVQCLFDIT